MCHTIFKNCHVFALPFEQEPRILGLFSTIQLFAVAFMGNDGMCCHNSLYWNNSVSLRKVNNDDDDRRNYV